MKFPIVRLPDFNKTFIIIPDASGYGTRAVLAQEHNGFRAPPWLNGSASTMRDRRSGVQFTWETSTFNVDIA